MRRRRLRVRLKLAGEGFAEELVDADEKGGEGFAGAGGRGDECGVAGEDGGPAFDLRLGGGAESGEEPLLNDGVGPCESFCRSGVGCGLHGLL